MLDVENAIYNKLKSYLVDNSSYNPKVFNKSPKHLKEFPTVIFKEENNIDVNKNKTLDFTQWANQITYTIEIYTQDLTLGNSKVASKIVLSELKYLVFDFFEYCGFERTSCEYVDDYGSDIDRLVISVRTNQASWNMMVM